MDVRVFSAPSTEEGYRLLQARFVDRGVDHQGIDGKAKGGHQGLDADPNAVEVAQIDAEMMKTVGGDSEAAGGCGRSDRITVGGDHGPAPIYQSLDSV